MSSLNMDALFYLSAQGDEEAKRWLYLYFRKKALKILADLISKYSKLPGIYGDFDAIIEENYLIALRDYEYDKGSFSWFTKTLLDKRLEYVIFDNNSKTYANCISINEELYEGISYEDTIEDRDIRPMNAEIAINNFKYVISSPHKSMTKKDRLKSRILMMRYAGYKDVEICKVLNITIGKFREIAKTFKDDEDLINFKLELK